jgi:hypothetical protein
MLLWQPARRDQMRRLNRQHVEIHALHDLIETIERKTESPEWPA